MSPITEKNLLFNAAPESCEADEIELAVAVVGTDDTSLETAPTATFPYPRP